MNTAFDIELFKVHIHFRILATLFDQFIKHILQIIFFFIDFTQNLFFLTLKHLNLLVQHIPEIFQIDLFISSILASFFLTIDHLYSFQ